ncbi:Ankyrin [Turneriella parva DSM 21527]|uniref:Ankyrin n=2 Tax=Turneriella TaxID=338321 RepID=I4B6V5_TURPD|nr:Ankyrin [Turneriella parva DSM 21527]
MDIRLNLVYRKLMKYTKTNQMRFLLLCIASLLLVDCSARNAQSETMATTPVKPEPIKTSSRVVYAAINRSLPALNDALAARENVNATDNYGRTAIMYAAIYGDMDMIKRLIKAKADLALRDKEDKTAVIHAHMEGHHEAMTYLHKVGKKAYGYWTITKPLPMLGDRTYIGGLYFSHPDGKGVLTTKQAIYKAEFKLYELHGLAEIEYASGSKFVGMYKNNKRNGKGTYTSSQGSYSGDFKDDKYHGKGVETFPDGIKYQGIYKNGERHGPGVYTTPDGRIDIVEYVDGKRK